MILADDFGNPWKWYDLDLCMRPVLHIKKWCVCVLANWFIINSMGLTMYSFNMQSHNAWQVKEFDDMSGRLQWVLQADKLNRLVI